MCALCDNKPVRHVQVRAYNDSRSCLEVKCITTCVNWNKLQVPSLQTTLQRVRGSSESEQRMKVKRSSWAELYGHKRTPQSRLYWQQPKSNTDNWLSTSRSIRAQQETLAGTEVCWVIFETGWPEQGLSFGVIVRLYWLEETLIWDTDDNCSCLKHTTIIKTFKMCKSVQLKHLMQRRKCVREDLISTVSPFQSSQPLTFSPWSGPCYQIILPDATPKWFCISGRTQTSDLWPAKWMC